MRFLPVLINRASRVDARGDALVGAAAAGSLSLAKLSASVGGRLFRRGRKGRQLQHLNEVKEGVHAWADDIVDTFAEFSSPKSYKSIKIGGNGVYTKKQKRRGKVSSEYKAKRKK